MNFIQYDHNVSLPIKVKFKNEPFDVTDSTVLVTIKLPNSKNIISKDTNVVNAKSGECEVILTNSDLYYAGNYYYQYTVITPDGLEFSGEAKRFAVSGKLEGKLLGMPEYDIPANLKGPKGDPGPQGPPGKSIDTTVINEQFQVIENKIKEVEESIGNGSGNGSGIQSFQKLSDLQTALPNGSVHPVWVVEENDWYYWSGDIPTDPEPADTTPPTLIITTGGTFTGTKTVTMSVNEAADIFYTLDGSTPTTSSNKYTTPLSISSTTTLKAFAKDTAGNASTIQTVVYTLDATPPVDTTPPENVTGLAVSNKTQTGLTLSWVASTSPDTASYDILNESTVIGNVTGTTFNVTGLLANTTYTFTVKAKDTSNNIASGSTISVTTLAIADTTPPILTITPPTTFTGTQSITMTVNETADIFYTLDGSTPTTSSNKYTTPLSISSTTTIKAFAKDRSGNSSIIQTVIFTKENEVPTIQNLFNKDTITPASQIGSDGNLTSNIAYCVSDWVKVKPSTKYSTNLGSLSSYGAGLVYVQMYKADKTFKGGTHAQNTPLSFTTANDVEWVRMTVKNTIINEFVIVEGNL